MASDKELIILYGPDGSKHALVTRVIEYKEVKDNEEKDLPLPGQYL